MNLFHVNRKHEVFFNYCHTKKTTLNFQYSHSYFDMIFTIIPSVSSSDKRLYNHVLNSIKDYTDNPTPEALKNSRFFYILKQNSRHFSGGLYVKSF